MKKDIRKEKLEKGKIIPLTFDYVFTSIFNNPENIKILENFLSCYLEMPLEKLRGKVKIVPRNLKLESKMEASKQVDLILELEDEKINIELSNRVNVGIINRNIVYACGIHSRNLKYGEKDYNNIGRTIQINLNHYHTNQKLKETYYLRNEEGRILSKKFRIDFLDMVIGKKMCYTGSENNLAKWCVAFTAETEEEFLRAVGEIMMEEEAREKLIDEVNKYSNDEEVFALYSAYTRQELEYNTFMSDAKEKGIRKGLKKGLKQGLKQGIQQGMKQGIEQGIEQGKRERNIEIAKTMLDNHYTINEVCEILKVTREQIETLSQMDT